MSRRIKCGEPDPDGEYGCEVMHQVISMDFETIERLTTELELAQLQLHSIRMLAIDWIQGVGEPMTPVTDGLATTNIGTSDGDS